MIGYVYLLSVKSELSVSEKVMQRIEFYIQYVDGENYGQFIKTSVQVPFGTSCAMCHEEIKKYFKGDLKFIDW
jgi:hypothetical protein